MKNLHNLGHLPSAISYRLLAISHSQPEKRTMKTMHTIILAAALGGASSTLAAERPADTAGKLESSPPATTNVLSAPASAAAPTQAAPIQHPASSIGKPRTKAP